jgi:hypothetical protein
VFILFGEKVCDAITGFSIFVGWIGDSIGEEKSGELSGLVDMVCSFWTVIGLGGSIGFAFVDGELCCEIDLSCTPKNFFRGYSRGSSL